MTVIIFIIFVILKNLRAYSPACKMIGNIGYTELSKNGDFIIGGLFSLDNSGRTPEQDFSTPPNLTSCRG